MKNLSNISTGVFNSIKVELSENPKLSGFKFTSVRFFDTKNDIDYYLCDYINEDCDMILVGVNCFDIVTSYEHH